MNEPQMRIGEVARRAGVRVSLIRYYEEIGLLPEPERVSGQRRYDETVLRRLSVIDVAQRAGLSLEEIRELVEHGTDPMSERLRELAARRLPEIDALIDRAQRVRTWLQTAQGCECESIDDCALFDDAPLATAQEARPLGGHVTPLAVTAGAAALSRDPDGPRSRS
jgi:MerR family transcriptional regulator, redox-sensitive transcriptional activator SoxR